MGKIDAIVDFEVAEMIRFYGSIVGTEGVSDKVKKTCNDNIEALLKVVQPKVTQITSGIIV